MKFEWPYYPAQQCTSTGLCDQGWCPFICMYVCDPPKKTSHRIYRLALPLRAPETFSSLSESRISLFNVHLIQLRSQNPIGKYRHLVN